MGAFAKELSARADLAEGVEREALRVATPADSQEAKAGKASDWSHSKPWLLGLILPTVLIIAWEISVRMGWVDLSLFSSPTQILSEISKLLAHGALLQHLGVTFLRVAAGFAMGVFTATLLGALTGFSRLSR